VHALRLAERIAHGAIGDGVTNVAQLPSTPSTAAERNASGS
jgi:hypothetical protein